MKTYRNLARKSGAGLVIAIMFMLLIPCLLTAETEGKYKVPQNSLSYFLQAPAADASKTEVPESTAKEVVQAQTVAETQTNKEPAAIVELGNFTEAPPVQLPETAIIESEAPVAEGTTEIPTISSPLPETETPANAAPISIDAPQPLSVEASIEQKDVAPLFSMALAKMQQTKAHRQAEAERLGIVLPSQGGDIASVSPALSKIQQTIRTIINR